MRKSPEENDKAALKKRIETLEQELLEERRKNGQFRKIFISKVNHEVRTPLNSILGFASLLSNESVESTRRKLYVKYLNSSIDMLLFRIENLLDYALLSPGQLELLEEENLSLNHLLEEIYEEFLIEKQFMGKNQVTLLLGRKKGTENIVATFDRGRMKKIFAILIRSALHGTREGSVEFGYEPLDDRTIRFYVADSAGSYHAEYVRKIFGKDPGRDQSQMEDNLDLSLVKELVALMKGKIDVTVNSGGTGNVVGFILPVKYRVLTTDRPIPEKEHHVQKHPDKQA